MIIIIIFLFSGWVVTVTPKGRFWLRGPKLRPLKSPFVRPETGLGGRGHFRGETQLRSYPSGKGY